MYQACGYNSGFMKRWSLSLVLGIAVSGKAAYAHHSIAGMYENNRQVTIEGVVSQFQFINPHPFVIVEVKTPTGGAQQWKLEMDNRSELVDAGMTSQSRKRGDRVVVTCSLIRPPQSQALYIRRLDRPADGFQYEQLGSSPHIRVPLR